MRVLSIDVGFKGGIAEFEVDSESNTYKLTGIIKMPVNKIKIKKKNKVKTKSSLNIPALKQIFKDSDIILIEDIFTFPRDGRVGAFNFGYQKGILVGVAQCYADEVILVDIKKWKKYFNISSDKQESVNYVNERFNLNLKKSQDGLAEAILIGVYWLESNLGVREEYNGVKS